MSQNSMRLSWTFEEVDSKLHDIMINIHKNAYEAAEQYGMKGNYVARCQYRGLYESSQYHDGAGDCLISFVPP